jgi:hypothetical protein
MTSQPINPVLLLTQHPVTQLINNGPNHPFVLPDELKNTLLAGIFQNELLHGNNSLLDIASLTTQQSQGNNLLLDLSCHTTRQYRIFMGLADHHPDSALMKQKLTAEFYLLKKDLLFATFLNSTDVSTNVSNSLSTQPKTTLPSLDTMSVNSEQKKPPPGSVPIVTHQNFACAQESLGPLILSSRKVSGSWAFVPSDCRGVEYKCQIPNCEVKWVIYGQTTCLGCSPAYLWSNGESHNHTVTTWADYYNSEVQSRDNLAAGHTSDPNNESTKARPGLPPMFKLAVENLQRANGTINGLEAARTVIDQLQTHPLLQESNCLTKVIMEQIRRQLRYKQTVNNKESIDRLLNVWDVDMFAKKYSFKFDLLASTEYTARLPETEKDVELMAIWFYENNLVVYKQHKLVNDHRQMFILRHPEVEKDSRIQELIKSKKHQTGKHPLTTTLVLTTMALLSNIVDCQRNNWNVQASADGTHNISSNNDILTCLMGFGCVSISRKGIRQWKPIAYGAGEGEREIVALITLLNIKYACRDIFGIEIQCFKGGLVSDHSSAIVNAYKHCFPESHLLQCYPHILRKFLNPMHRSENGQYRKHLSSHGEVSSKWLYSTARKDIQNLFTCRTKEQFRCYAEMVHKAWTEMGQGSLSNTFQKSYITNDSFNNWWSTSSGVPGYTPDNNPLESFHKQIKGGQLFRGIIEKGKPYHVVVNDEFPKLLWWNSTERTGVTQHFPIVQEEKAFKDDAVLELLKGFKYEIDVFPCIQHQHGIDGWLVNHWTRLNQPITAEDATKYVRCLNGEFAHDYKDRHKLVEFVNQFHHMEEVSNAKVGKYYQCSCPQFYQSRYCPFSALMQHKLTLLSKGKSVGKAKPKKNSKRKRMEEIVKCVNLVTQRKASLVIESNDNLDMKIAPVPSRTTDE